MKFPHDKLSDNLRRKIQSKGTEVFKKITSSDIEVINSYFEPHGLEYVIPNEKYIEKNISDARFALKNVPLSKYAYEKLLEKLHFLEFQDESLKTYKERGLEKPGKYFLFFHEKNGDWSIVNLFDTNVVLWIKLMSKHLDKHYKDNLEKFVDWYFSSRQSLIDLVQAMVEKAIHYENIFKKTWGGGTQNEDDFINELLIEHNIDKDRIKKFSGGGNIVDLVGIDVAIKCGDSYVPVQIKSNQKLALSSIPFKGIGVFPYENTFYYSWKSNDVPKPIEKFFLEDCK